MKNPFSDLIFMFFIIIFLLLAVYISYFGYEKKYLPTRLSNFQYSTYKTHNNLPEGIDSLSASSLIGQCPPGQCVLDISTGLKRCPQNPTSKMTYNIIEEACTKINSCDYIPLPYAARSDGSAIDNICEKSPDGDLVPCRCTKNKTCAGHQLSKFIIKGGDPSKTTNNNFYILQSNFESQDAVGYSPVELDDLKSEFCQINPGFAGILSHGCDFSNSVQDKLGCQTISNITLGSLTQKTAWKLSSDIKIGQTFVDLQGPNPPDNLQIPSKGELVLTSPSPVGTQPDATKTVTRTETVSYSGVQSITLDKKNNRWTTRVINIFSISLTEEGSIQNDGIPGRTGFQGQWYFEKSPDTPESLPPTIAVTANQTVNCSVANTVPNYKNMLICTQKDNNVCKFGTFSYNFDRLSGIKDNTLLTTDETFTRNFCQMTATNNRTLQRSNYLQDPEFYTLSCAIGSGCNGQNFQKNAVDESNSKYFPEVDIDGIHGIWNVQNLTTFPGINLKNPGGRTKVNGVSLRSGRVLLNNENLQAGDFWSIKILNQNLISGPKRQTGTSIIVVQDLFGLDNYVNGPGIPNKPGIRPTITIGEQPPYELVRATYGVCVKTGKNISTIGISPSLVSGRGVSPFSDIRIKPPDIKSKNTYGIVVKDHSTPGTSFIFTTLKGETIDAKQFDFSVDLSIYKQFSFSGPNYGTKPFLVNRDNTVVGGVSYVFTKGNYRAYTTGIGSSYMMTIHRNKKTPAITQMVPPENIYQLNVSTSKGTSLNLNYYSPQAPFKIPTSMYYPVWNPVLYQQECIRCKPLLLTYPELDVSKNLSNVIIQFSGKDFGNYEYNADPGAGNNKYCYVTTSEINFNNTQDIVNTTQRIMLKEPNLDVNIGDYVLDSTLQMPYNIFSEGNLDKTKTYYSFFIAPQIFPSGESIKYFSENCLDKSGIDNNGFLNWPNPVTKNPFTINFGIDESTSENFVYKSDSSIRTLFPNQLGTIRWSNSSNSWNLTPTTPGNDASTFATNPNNYFFGKKYQSLFEYKSNIGGGVVDTSGFYFVPTQKVTGISADRKTIIVDSLFPKKILQRKTANIGAVEPTYVQFCRLDSPLKLDVTTGGGGVVKTEEVVINSICDSRITDIKITKTGSKFLLENVPQIKLNLNNQKFL